MNTSKKKLTRGLIIAVGLFVALALPSFASAQTSAGAPVGDFFAELEKYDSLAGQRAQNTSNTGSAASAANPLAIRNYFPASNTNSGSGNESGNGNETGNNSESNSNSNSNSNQLLVNDTNDESTKLALAGSAQRASGEYGEVVRFNNDSPQYFQASAISARGNSSGALNSGGLLLFLLVVLVAMFVVRRYYKRKPRGYAPAYARRASFNDMNRYHGAYQYR